MTRKGARVALGLLALVAAAEWVAAAAAYRTSIPPSLWADLRARTAALPPGEPLFLADAWLGPRARHELPALRGWASVAPPDLHGLRRFHVLAEGAPWTRDLLGDLGDAPPPPVAAALDLGPLTLHTFEVADAPTLTDSWIDAGARLDVRDPEGRCRRRGDAWACKRGQVRLTTAEIGYRPRRGLCLDLDDGASVTLTLDAELGDHLRGHVGFADFNARLRSDAPLLLTLRIDGRPLPSLVVTDTQGWRAFEAPTEPGRHEVELELRPATTGTWADAGYRPQPRHLACLELRAFRSKEAP